MTSKFIRLRHAPTNRVFYVRAELIRSFGDPDSENPSGNAIVNGDLRSWEVFETVDDIHRMLVQQT